jgi:transcriptional regulator with XRE-family HTH domain
MATTDAEQQAGWVPDAADAFGARLALLRQRMGWGNVKEAAAACGLPVESWRNWERDNREPRNYLEICRTISNATGVDFMWLLTGQAPAEGGPVVDMPEQRRTGARERFSCSSGVTRVPAGSLRTRLHRPARIPAGIL